MTRQFTEKDIDEQEAYKKNHTLPCNKINAN